MKASPSSVKPGQRTQCAYDFIISELIAGGAEPSYENFEKVVSHYRQPFLSSEGIKLLREQLLKKFKKEHASEVLHEDRIPG